MTRPKSNGAFGPRTQPISRDEGFTLVEVLVSAGLALVLIGLVSSLLAGQVSMARAQPEAVDLQQRARVTADILSAELTTAGAWGDSGGVSLGLACCVPVVHPRRIGTRLADPTDVAKGDVLTLVRVAAGARAGRLGEPIPGVLVVRNGEGCTPSSPVCGLREDDHVIVFEESGNHDFFVLGRPAADSAPLNPRQAAPASAFAPGAIAVGIETRTFYFDQGTRQLRLYDGHLSDMPIVDDVVAMRVEYWGTPGIPARARAEVGTGTCWFDQAGQPRHGRAVTVPGAPNVRLTLDEFRDGPWCGAGDNRFDADLLRVRHVRAVVRLAASAERARGIGADFLVPGRAVSAMRLVPDVDVIVDAAPRSLNGDY